MNLKYCFYILCTAFVIALTSCLGGDDETEIIYSSDAEILTFKLDTTDISGLSGLLYTIDQLKGEIYNMDSLYFSGEMPAAVKLSCTTAGVAACLISSTNEDSTVIGSEARIDITPFVNQLRPFLRVYAMNGGTKDYKLNLRISTTDPDSIAYTELSGSLPYTTYTKSKTILLNGTFYSFADNAGATSVYSSTDAQNWLPAVALPAGTKVESVGVYKTSLYMIGTDGKLYGSADASSWTQVTLGAGLESVAAVLGEIKAVSPVVSPVMSLICKSGSDYVFVETDMNTYWKAGDVVSADFPVKDFATTSWTKSYASYLILVGGASTDGTYQNAVWTTEGNGLSWTKTVPKGNRGAGFVTPSQSPNVFYYNNMLYLMNGKYEGTYRDSVYTSIDGGLTWQGMDAKYAPYVAGYQERNNSSVCVDENNFIYIFGGQGSSGVLTNIWRGRMNRLRI